jgi:folate-binding protein YgfZ
MRTPPAIPAGFIAGQADIVWLAGADRLSFLERMSTARLADLAPRSGRATFVLTDTGRVVDLVSCHAGASGAALVTSGPGAAAAVSAHLRRYLLFGDDVRVTDASAQVTVLRVFGSDARKVATKASGISAEALPPGAFIEQGEDAETVWLLAHPAPGGMGGIDIVVPAGPPAEAMAARLHAADAARWDRQDLDLARIEAGQPAHGAEFGGASDTQANPLELNLKAVVDFAKGCYIGQEVVARLENYERVQRRLVRLTSGSQLVAGDRVVDAGEGGDRRSRPGLVTTAAAGREGDWVALALVPLAWADAPEVGVETGAGRVAAAVESGT